MRGRERMREREGERERETQRERERERKREWKRERHRERQLQIINKIEIDTHLLVKWKSKLSLIDFRDLLILKFDMTILS